jgi:hypothetical protein
MLSSTALLLQTKQQPLTALTPYSRRTVSSLGASSSIILHQKLKGKSHI